MRQHKFKLQKQSIAKKYIKTVELAQLTGRPYNEILSLVNTGVLPGHKTHRGRWWVIINENHYREAAKTDMGGGIVHQDDDSELQTVSTKADRPSGAGI